MPRLAFWIGLAFAVCTAFVLTSSRASYTDPTTIQLTGVLTALLLSTFERSLSFYVRAWLHLGATLYFFLSGLLLFGFGRLYPDAGWSLFAGFGVWIFVMLSQFWIKCPNCGAMYALIHQDSQNPSSLWSGFYAPWNSRHCAACGADKAELKAPW